VTGFDLDGRRVVVDRGDPLPYDYLVIAAGGQRRLRRARGARARLPDESVDGTVRLRHSILDRLERVAAGPDAPAEGELSVVICGGPTGVEVAGALQELFDKVIARDFPGPRWR
jgi:NADH dehydrogenase